jgi:hypothetical protein
MEVTEALSARLQREGRLLSQSNGDNTHSAGFNRRFLRGRKAALSFMPGFAIETKGSRGSF